MKEEILKIKKENKQFEALDEIISKMFDIKTEESELVKMVDLMAKNRMKARYLETFMNALGERPGVEEGKKYNIKKVNEHLEKILEEYTQLVDELDKNIFREDDEIG